MAGMANNKVDAPVLIRGARLPRVCSHNRDVVLDAVDGPNGIGGADGGDLDRQAEVTQDAADHTGFFDENDQAEPGWPGRGRFRSAPDDVGGTPNVVESW